MNDDGEGVSQETLAIEPRVRGPALEEGQESGQCHLLSSVIVHIIVPMPIFKEPTWHKSPDGQVESSQKFRLYLYRPPDTKLTVVLIPESDDW